MGPGRYLDLLRENPSFARLYGAQLVSFAGEGHVLIASV